MPLPRPSSRLVWASLGWLASSACAATPPGAGEKAPRPQATAPTAEGERPEARPSVAVAFVVDLTRGVDLVGNALSLLRRELDPSDEVGVFAPGRLGPRTLRPLALGDFDPRDLRYESLSLWSVPAAMNRAAEALSGSLYSERRLLVLVTDGRHPSLPSLGSRVDRLCDAGELSVSVVVVRPPRYEREGPEPDLGALLTLSRGFSGHDTHGLVALTNALSEDLAALRAKPPRAPADVAPPEP